LPADAPPAQFPLTATSQHPPLYPLHGPRPSAGVGAAPCSRHDGDREEVA
jgi:hypothetical protein